MMSWWLHPRAEYFLARGGAEAPPPVYCNVALTSKCNLRCEICGSQKHLDDNGIRRRHMDFGVFEQVAQTVFPVVYEVELNSQGDPLLHPRIADVLAAIARHGCNVKVQTNGTLFSDRVIEVLAAQCGFVMLSLDAVGPRFDEVRRGGRWSEAEPRLRRFLAARDPARMRVGLYPTLTRRTVGEAPAIVRWAVDQGVEEVAFHRYVPIQGGSEEAPSAEELARASEAVRRWSRLIEIKMDGAPVDASPPLERRTQFASLLKRRLALEPRGPGNMFPMPAGARDADPRAICMAPWAYVDVGLDGQISACCRSQDVPLGHATSVEAFAGAWLGANYRRLRASLERGAGGELPLENCGPCIAQHAPGELGGRRARHALDFSSVAYVRLEAIRHELQRCHVSSLPPGIEPQAFVLYEDETPLGPAQQLHDDIRLRGRGRFSIWGRAVYFSASDNTDPRANGRCYSLRRL